MASAPRYTWRFPARWPTTKPKRMRPVTAINTLRPRVERAGGFAEAGKPSQTIRRAAARQAGGAGERQRSVRVRLLAERPAQGLQLLLRLRRELALDPDLALR